MDILLTGSTGFLGRHVLDFLLRQKFEVIKVGRNINSDVICDLSVNKLKKIEADVVIHIAGKAHSYPKKIEEKNEFFKVNYFGTLNLLDGLGLKKLKCIIFISSVAVYGKEVGELIDEKSPLLGDSPYALSKINAENAIVNFGIKNNIKVVILRLPLITGKHPQGNLKDIINAIKKGYYFRAGMGRARKSLIAASDVANIIPELFKLNGTFNLTDCSHPMICEIDTAIAKSINKKIKKLPVFVLLLLAKFGDLFHFIPFNSSKLKKLTNNLTFSNKKILKLIKYRPTSGLSEI